MPPSVSGKGKADENKTNKIIQLRGQGSCRNKQLYFEAVFWITDLLTEAAK